MKKSMLTATLLAALLVAATPRSSAQVPVISVVSSAIKKIIIAMDLKVQQLQNQTIALQNAEQNIENKMSLGNLDDISGWLGKERSLYENYYHELSTVKTIISDYDEVRQIISQQEELVAEYKAASSQFNRDRHFSASELRQMADVYKGILEESGRNLDEALLAVKSFSTQMSDAERLLLVHRAAQGEQKNLDNLRQFNTAAARLSLLRARDGQDKEAVMQLYGLN